MATQSVRLPELPADAEDAISAAIDSEPAARVSIGARSASTFRRIASFDPVDNRHASDLRDRIVSALIEHVAVNGRSPIRLEAGDKRVIWEAYTGDALDTPLPFPQEGPLSSEQLLRLSWELTFRATQRMLDVAGLIPGALQQVGAMFQAVVQMQRDNVQQSEAVSVKAIESDAQVQKLDRLYAIADKLINDQAPANRPTATGEPKWRETQREIARAPSAIELATLGQFEEWTSVLTADSAEVFARAIDKLWPLHTTGRVSLSKETLARAREIVTKQNMG